MKIEIFKRKKSFKKGGFHTDPNIGWRVVLCVMLLLVLASFVFGFLLFRQVSVEFATPIAVSAGNIPTVKKEKIDKALQYFSEREQKSAGILNSPSDLVDPSL